MANKMPDDEMPVADAKRQCRAHGTTLAALARQYAANTGRSIYTSYTCTRIKRDVFNRALQTHLALLQPWAAMTPAQAIAIAQGVYDLHGAIHQVDEHLAEQFATDMDIIGHEPSADVVARTFLGWLANKQS